MTSSVSTNQMIEVLTSKSINRGFTEIKLFFKVKTYNLFYL